MGWMQGSPPPADRQIRYDDRSFSRFPQSRWSFSHMRELRPSVEISRGKAAVTRLRYALRSDLDAVTFTPLGGKAPMTWADSLIANYTDGIVVLHRGSVVYERYFGALKADTPHIAFSVTKSLMGTLAGILITEGKLDPAAKVAHYLPEMARGGFGDATVAQLLDMTTALDFDENYAGSPTFDVYAHVTGKDPRPAGSTEPKSLLEYLPTIARKGTHGPEFHYRTPNVDVLAWIITRLTGKSTAALLSERIWSRIGAEDDAFMQVEESATPLAGFGLNARLRDLARFGEMIRLGGKVRGQQVIPAAVVDEIRRGGDRAAFVHGNYPTLPGWSYHHFWWVSHDDHGMFMARGIHGQAVYVNPKAQLVIARFASHPNAGNVGIDPTSLPAYRAIAEYLMAR